MKKNRNNLLTIALIISLVANIVFVFILNNNGSLTESKLNFINELINVEVIDVNDTEVIFTIENSTDFDYSYGSGYYLEIKENDKWYVLEPIEEMMFTSQAFWLSSNDKVKLSVDYEYGYGKLTSGKYRIIKSISLSEDENTELYDVKYVYAEFEVK